MLVFAHLSDMHVSPLPPLRLRELTLKRVLAYLSWHRKRKHRFSVDVLHQLIADMKDQCVQHVLVTGDQCNLSLEREFVNSAAWLAEMGTPPDVSIVPGNHDAHLHRPHDMWKKHWAHYMCSDDGRVEFPYLRIREGVAVIGVSSAIPTALFFANGRVGNAQLKRLKDVLEQCKAAGLFRVVMIHHPPQAGAMQWRKALSDAPAFRAILHEAGAELVLHGHGHAAVRAEIAGPTAPIAVRGVASASGNGHRMPPAHYHVIQLETTDSSWQAHIAHRQVNAACDGFELVASEALTISRI